MKRISLVLMLVVLGAVLLTGCDSMDVTVSGDLVKEYAGTYRLTESLSLLTYTVDGQLTKKLVPLSAEKLARIDFTYTITEKGKITRSAAEIGDLGSYTSNSVDGTLFVNKTRVRGHAGNWVLIFTMKVSFMTFSSEYKLEYDPRVKTLTDWTLSNDEDDSVNGVNAKAVYTLELPE
jgi:predicted small secreted protein